MPKRSGAPYKDLPVFAEFPWTADGNKVFGYQEPPIEDADRREMEDGYDPAVLIAATPALASFIAKTVNEFVTENANRRHSSSQDRRPELKLVIHLR